LNWNITYVTASPDGYARRFIGINGQWPNPAITGTIGDTLKINVVNGLGDQYTSIHFHGISQQNTTFEDGPVGVTQCPISPGQSFVYQFRFLQTGTYWYHAHIGECSSSSPLPQPYSILAAVQLTFYHRRPIHRRFPWSADHQRQLRAV
jgi:iron transport multicopper oxidase